MPLHLRESGIFEMLLIQTHLTVRFILKPLPLTIFLLCSEDGIQATCLFCCVILRILIPGVPAPNKLTRKAAAVSSIAIFSLFPAFELPVSCLGRDQSPLSEKKIPVI